MTRPWPMPWKLGAALFALLAIGLPFSCTPTDAYRSRVEVVEGCVPQEVGGKLGPSAPLDCRSASTERASATAGPSYAYTLHTIEFDDQGWSRYLPGAQVSQMDSALNAIRARLERNASGAAPPNLQIVVYVHGWKHNAGADDSNVENFRALLRQVSTIEDNGAGSRREVVGVYVGWRGDSLRLPDPIKSATFWDRKNTAAEVAQGTVRELFARLDAIADSANANWLQLRGTAARAQRAPDPSAAAAVKRVRVMYLGHSFGGHILLTALGGSVLRDMAAFDERLRSLPGEARANCDWPKLNRDGDMIVLINPAVEGTRFQPLAAVTRAWTDQCHHAPVLVSITSKGDWATRYAFTAGRFVSTLLEEYVNGDERNADRQTFGHDANFVTHHLKTFEGYVRDAGAGAVLPKRHGNCEQWDVERNFIGSVTAEWSSNRAHARAVNEGIWDVNAARGFCAGTVLLPVVSDARLRAPVLNILADADLIPDHNDIFQPRFVSFVRELYLDTSGQLRTAD